MSHGDGLLPLLFDRCFPPPRILELRAFRANFSWIVTLMPFGLPKAQGG